MPEIRFKTPPHDQQLKFMDEDEPEQLFGGAKRGGKSVGLSQKIIMLSMAFPGNRGLLYRQNLTDLKDSTLVTFEDICPPGLIRQHHKGDRKFIFTNGSHFIYRGVGDKDELEKVKGIDLGWMAGDEPSEVELATYLMLLAQLNWKLPNGKRPPYMSLLACNPEPGWVKQRFIDPLPKDGKGAITNHRIPGKVFIPSLPNDNPYLPPGYVQWLRDNFPAEWVDKYVRGSWEVSEGMVYKEFDARTHVVDYYPPLREMKLYASLDHATTGVTAFHVLGQTSNSDFFCIREYYKRDRLVADHAASILQIIEGLRLEGGASGAGELEYTLIDPATAQRSSQGNYQLQDVASLYAEAGINTIPAWNTIEAGVERVKQLLHPVSTHIHPLTGAVGSPHFFISRHHAPELVQEFMGWKKDVTPEGYVKYKGPDHGLDNIRYIAVSRPAPPAATPRDQAVMGSMTAFAQRSHANWLSKFNKEIRKQNGLGGRSYF